MRILYVTPHYEAGSLASLTHHVTHALVRLAQREGHQVRVGSVVESPGAHGSVQWVGGAAVTALSCSVARAEPAAFAQWLQAQQVDVIHCIALTPEDVDLPWPPSQLPTVVTLTGLPGNAQNTPTWLRQARHRVCATPAAQAAWQTTGLAFRVLPHGVDLLGLLRKFAHRFSDAPVKGVPTVASAEQLHDVASPVHGVPLHPVSLMGMDAVDAVVMAPTGAVESSLVPSECAALGLPCLQPSQLSTWLAQQSSAAEPPALQCMDRPMPPRIEEEAFFYDCLYRQ